MARRGGSGIRLGLGFLLLGVLLAALLVVGDRAADRFFENRASEQLQRQLSTATPPSVDIDGFPFLTQLLAGSLSSVHVVADQVAPPGRPGTALGRVDVTLQSVSSPDRFRTFTAARVDGTGTLDYASAQQLSGYPLAYAEEGRVELTLKTEFASLPVTAQVTGRPEVDVAAQTLSLTEPELSMAGVDVPDTTSQALLDRLLAPVPIVGVPYGLTISDVAATPTGLQATIQGSNISFTR
jgi:hypothetical protein